MFSFYDSARSVKWDLLAQDKQKDVNNMHFPLTAKLLQINDYQQYCEWFQIEEPTAVMNRSLRYVGACSCSSAQAFAEKPDPFLQKLQRVTGIEAL